MSESIQVDPLVAIMTQLFTTATHHASVAMSNWTNGQVVLTLEAMRHEPIEEMTSQLNIGADPQTMVLVGVDGALEGQMVLVFDDENGRQLANGLIGRTPSGEQEWTEIERSAIMETGNIFGSAYLSELSRLLHCDLRPTPPYFVQDFGASVVEQALMLQAMESDRAFVCQTQFEFNQKKVDWHVLFIPGSKMMQAMADVLASVG